MAPGVIISAAMVAALVLLANVAAGGGEVHMTTYRGRQLKANQLRMSTICSMSENIGGCADHEMMSGRDADEVEWAGAAGAGVKRLLLQTTSTSSYISYGALTADTVPCSTAGASYYDCTSSSAANPYTRPCTTITDCARDTS